MKLYSWNVNGIRAVQKKGFVDWVLKESPDILCLQETKAHFSQLDEELTQIDGYESYWNAPARKGYSGVATYTKEKPLSVQYGIGVDRIDEEGRIIVTEYPSFTLLNIYFPNGQKDQDRLDYKLDFYDEVLEYCNELVTDGKKVIICGDFNTAHHPIDLTNPKANEKYSGFLPIERESLSKWIDCGFVDSFRHFYPETVKYSWWSYRMQARPKNVGWRIDYFLVSGNMIDDVKDAEIRNDVMGSDHCPVVLHL
ncbi:MAG: exodeoxyribonuclease III [Clostridiales bacterium]|nr:exodeoxyribonuclease III [Clostridiales bacterium]